MTLHFIGLGLGDEKDITVKGLESIKKCEKIFLEQYTSILSVDKERLEEFYGKEVLLADRDLVEKNAEVILEPAKKGAVAFLVVGDPFGATTHTDLFLRAKELGITVTIIHNASIMNAIGELGLELYKYGKTTSIPFWEEGFEPMTPYDAIKENKEHGLHTLCLLDIKVKELSKEELLRERTKKIAIVPRFMSIRIALQQLQKMEETRKEGIITDETLAIGVARLGQQDQKIIAGTLKELADVDFGGPLHSLIIPGRLQVVEEEALEMWKLPLG